MSSTLLVGTMLVLAVLSSVCFAYVLSSIQTKIERKNNASMNDQSFELDFRFEAAMFLLGILAIIGGGLAVLAIP